MKLFLLIFLVAMLACGAESQDQAQAGFVTIIDRSEGDVSQLTSLLGDGNIRAEIRSASNEAQWKGYLPPQNGVDSVYGGWALLIDPKGRRFAVVQAEAEMTIQELADALRSAVGAHERLLDAESIWLKEPNSENLGALVKLSAGLAPRFKRGDFRVLMADIAGKQLEWAATPPSGSTDELQKLHSKLLLSIRDAWDRGETDQVLDKIDQFVKENGLEGEIRQKLEMHKYRYFSLRHDFDRAIEMLDKIRLIDPSGHFSDRVAEIRKQAMKKRSESSAGSKE